MFQRIQNVHRKVITAAMSIASIFVFLPMVYGFINVIGRYFFNRPVGGVIEFTGEAMVYIIFLGAAYVQIRKGHIRIDFLTGGRLNERGKGVLDILSCSAGILFFGLTVWFTIGPAVHSLKTAEATYGSIFFPIYPQRIAVTVGSFLLAFQLLLDLVESIKKLTKAGLETDSGVGGQQALAQSRTQNQMP
jgi:TRAP-type C4-dicarboxylate transport system permease small subunit